MPPKLFSLLEKDAGSKLFAYSQKTRCLKLFQRIVEGREGDDSFAAIYAAGAGDVHGRPFAL